MKRALSRAEYIRRVADSIYQTRTIQMIAHDLGLAPGEVDWSGPSRLVWSEVLVHAERNGQFEPLLRRIGDEVEDLRDVAIDAPTLQGSIPPPGGNWSPVVTASFDQTARIWNLDPTVARSVGCALVRGKPVWDDPLRRDALRAACANVR